MKLNSSRLRIHLARGMLLASLGTLSVHADYQSTVLSQGPAGYWRLNETAPAQAPITNAVNLGSLGTAGTYEGSQGFFRGFPGALANSGTAVHFDGSSQDVLVPYNAALNPSTFSIEGWLYADAAAANCALSCGDFGNPRAGWLIYQTGGTGYELRMYKGGGTAVAANPVGNVGNVVGVYTHVVATFDGTTARIYLNGVLSASDVPNAPYLPGVSGPFTIGERADTGFRWSGKADEVAYYNTALSPSVIAAHY
ncbi:MAG: Laminin sub domain 2, partial [Pedosphaera sp.]|nr:Laminin sub domain 2 [Pedosphaera sp.]